VRRAVTLAATRALRWQESPLLVHLLPRTCGEKLAFSALAVAAGTAEELLFRGFLLPALDTATGSAALAALLGSAVFGFLHNDQRLAGTAEELLFRGFLLPALDTATGSAALAALLGSAVFGFLHNHQRLAGTARAATIGLLLALPVLATGSLLPSIAAHIATDLAAGLLLADWLLRRE